MVSMECYLLSRVKTKHQVPSPITITSCVREKDRAAALTVLNIIPDPFPLPDHYCLFI